MELCNDYDRSCFSHAADIITALFVLNRRSQIGICARLFVHNVCILKACIGKYNVKSAINYFREENGLFLFPPFYSLAYQRRESNKT